MPWWRLPPGGHTWLTQSGQVSARALGRSILTEGWLNCPETLQSSSEPRLLRLYIDVEHPDPQFAGVRATGLEGLIDIKDQIHHVRGPELSGRDGERQDCRRLSVGRELPNRLVGDLDDHLLRRGEEVGPGVVLQVDRRVLLGVA